MAYKFLTELFWLAYILLEISVWVGRHLTMFSFSTLFQNIFYVISEYFLRYFRIV